MLEAQRIHVPPSVGLLVRLVNVAVVGIDSERADHGRMKDMDVVVYQDAVHVDLNRVISSESTQSRIMCTHDNPEELGITDALTR